MSARTIRIKTSVFKRHLSQAAQPKKHKFDEGIDKCINHMVKNQYADQRGSLLMGRTNVQMQKRETQFYHNPLLSAKMRTYRKQIQKCKTMEEVHECLSNLPKISKKNLTILCDDVLKQYGKLKNPHQCLSVLKTMYKLKIPRSIMTYNVIFDAFMTYDDTKSAIKIYYEYMLKYEKDIENNEDLRPNIITANTLLAGCKHKADIDLCKLIWNDFIIEYDIAPNLATYIILITIYGRAGLADHCYQLFTHMIVNEGIEANTGACGALMNAFAIKGEVYRCRQIMHYMLMNRIPIGSMEYCTLMKCHLLAQQPFDALNIYQEVIKKIELDKRSIMIFANLRMNGYSKLIQNILDKEIMTEVEVTKVKNYFKMMMQEIPYDVKLQSKSESDNFYKYLDDKLLQQMLNVLVVMNEHSHRLNHEYENEMLTFLENGLKNHRFGFWNAQRKNMVDFHHHWSKNAVLVLRYLMSFGQKYIKQHLKCDLKIIVGVGTHSEGRIRRDIQTGEVQGCLMSDAILNEINSWTPSVKVTKHENNAVLSLDSNDLKCFLDAHSHSSPWFKGRKTK